MCPDPTGASARVACGSEKMPLATGKSLTQCGRRFNSQANFNYKAMATKSGNNVRWERTWKHGFILAAWVSGLLAAPWTRGQGILVVSNTNQPVTGFKEEMYGARAAFVTGFNPSGYQLTGLSVMFGDNPSTDYTNILIDLFQSNAPGNLDQEIGSFTVPTPRTAGIYFYPWPTNFFLAAQRTNYATLYNEIEILPGNNTNGYIDDYLNVAYTDSTDYTANAGWTFVPSVSPINGTLGICPILNIFATVLPPPVLHPIHLINAVALTNGSFQFGFTNSPGLSFTAYATTNLALSFTHWFIAGYPENVASNYYQYTTGPGVVTDAAFVRVYFRVSSP